MALIVTTGASVVVGFARVVGVAVVVVAWEVVVGLVVLTGCAPPEQVARATEAMVKRARMVKRRTGEECTGSPRICLPHKRAGEVLPSVW